MADQLSPERILQTGFAFWPSKTLLSAVELGVFTELAQGGLSLADLTSRLSLHQRSARDFFDTLVALGFLGRDGDRYSNTAETDLFLDRGKPSYIGGMLEMCNARLYRFWGDLTEGLRTGLPQNEVKQGRPGLFDALYADPDRLKQFLAAMTGLSRGANMTIARNFPWATHKTFADVGTAQGDLAVQIALANPHLRGRGFDLPIVQPIFDEYVAQAGIADRLTFQPGDFFNDPTAERRRAVDGAHPSRLGSHGQAHAHSEGVRCPARRRRAHRLRIDHRRRPLEECVRADDEPQHADRNAGGLRLHRRRLFGMDEGRRVRVDAGRAAHRSRLDGHRHQVTCVGRCATVSDAALRELVGRLLAWEDAHATFDSAVDGLPPAHRGVTPPGLPYSPWQLLEHVRLAQEDILDFCRNPHYREMTWPDDFWPASAAPPDGRAWEESVRRVREDRHTLQAMAADPSIDLGARIPHGRGQTYLRELLLVADHNAYHVGQLVLVRRLLGSWPSP